MRQMKFSSVVELAIQRGYDLVMSTGRLWFHFQPLNPGFVDPVLGHDVRSGDELAQCLDAVDPDQWCTPQDVLKDLSLDKGSDVKCSVYRVHSKAFRHPLLVVTTGRSGEERTTVFYRSSDLPSWVPEPECLTRVGGGCD